MENKQVTIQGVLVSISQPYEPGHTITEAEAKALNQVRAENIGNNKRGEIKKMLDEDGASPESVQKAAQKLVTVYDGDYEFTLATVGGATRLDPLTKECRAIAKSLITRKLKEAGVTQKAYVEEHGKETFTAKVLEIAENAKVVEAAKKALAERGQMAGIDISV